MGKHVNFETMESLSTVSLIIEEAGEAVNDKTRTILNSPISDVLIAAGGLGAGAAVNLAIIHLVAGKQLGKLGMPALLHVLKQIGGGSAKRGMLFLAIPAAVLTLGANIIAKTINKKQLQQAKERLLQQACEKLAAVLATQKEEIHATKIRADELIRLNVLLTDFIAKLKEDLGQEAVGELVYE